VIRTAAALALAAAIAAAPAAAIDSRQIRAGKSFQRLGDFRITKNPTQGGAYAAVGEPTTCRTGPSNHAIAHWRDLGVKIEFWTYGAHTPGRSACDDPKIWVSEIFVTGRTWLTSLGLHVGDSVAELRRLYPRAIYRQRDPRRWNAPNAYFLVSRMGGCIGLCGGRLYTTVPKLYATVRDGRVTSLVLPVFAQGE
jgi:hypothetical protein